VVSETAWEPQERRETWHDAAAENPRSVVNPESKDLPQPTTDPRSPILHLDRKPILHLDRKGRKPS
jgi:hypothetical protein